MYKKNHLLQKPESVFVVTELKISAYPHASAYIACNALGLPLAPLVVLHSAPVDKARLTAYSLPEFKDALFFNAKGAHDGDALFVWFRDHFMQFKARYHSRCVILFVSCPVSEMSLRLVQLAEEEHVALVSLPSTIAHLVQPLSSGTLHSVNAAISAGIEQLIADGRLASGTRLSHSLLAMLLAEVWADKWPCNDVTDAFALCGIFPLNVRAITAEHIAAAMPSDDVGESFIKTESGEDVNEDVTHGLNLLCELSTLEQQKESCSERLVAEGPRQCYKNVNETGGAYASADASHNRLQCKKAKVSREVLNCYIADDKNDQTSLQAYADLSSAVVCQPNVCSRVTSQNDDDQFDHAQNSVVVSRKRSVRESRQRVISASDRTAGQSNYDNVSSVQDKNRGDVCDETHDNCDNSFTSSNRQNMAAKVGWQVVNTEACDTCVTGSDARQKVTDNRLNEPQEDAESVLCDSVPLCSEPQSCNSNIDATLHVIYCSSIGHSVPTDIEQDNSDRTEYTQIELDVAAECDIEDSCQQVCCEVII